MNLPAPTRDKTNMRSVRDHFFVRMYTLHAKNDWHIRLAGNIEGEVQYSLEGHLRDNSLESPLIRHIDEHWCTYDKSRVSRKALKSCKAN